MKTWEVIIGILFCIGFIWLIYEAICFGLSIEKDFEPKNEIKIDDNEPLFGCNNE